MSFGKTRNPTLAISKSLDANVFILNTKDNLGKFDAKSDVGIFLGYSTSSKAFRVFNKRTMVVVQSIHVIFPLCIGLSQKNETFYEFSKFCNKVQNEKGFAITFIRSDHGREFENVDFENYCNEHGIDHNFLAPRTPQQNEVVERKNRTIQQMARTMLNENNLLKYFCAKVVNILVMF